MKNIEDLQFLNEEHISQILGVPLKRAQAIMNSDGFPLLRLGHIKRVEKSKFFSWLDQQTKN